MSFPGRVSALHDGPGRNLADPSPPPEDLNSWKTLGAGYICAMDPHRWGDHVAIYETPECLPNDYFLNLRICSSVNNSKCPREGDHGNGLCNDASCAQNPVLDEGSVWEPDFNARARGVRQGQAEIAGR